jgi:protease YdgD
MYWPSCFGLALAPLVAALLLGRFAGAAELPLLPGVGAGDHRIAVDPRQPPWDAIAKVQTNIGTGCTGALVAPSVVLTAAHCLYNVRTRALLQPVSLHVLLGYERADYRWHRLVARYVVGPGFDGGRHGPQGSDWARLELAEAIPDLVVPLGTTDEFPVAGEAVALAGYNQDRAQVLMADVSCHVTGVVTIEPARYIAHDCDATRGTSGGPLLVQSAAGWTVIGINIGIVDGLHVALPAAAFDSSTSAPEHPGRPQ